MPQPIFDGHHDALTHQDHAGIVSGRAEGHFDLPRAAAGGLVASMWAIFCHGENTNLDFAPNPGGGYDWADRFDEAARAIMLGDPSTIGELRGHRDWRLAVPTPDHFLPLAYIAGAAGDVREAGEAGGVRVSDEGRAMGSLSMTGYLYE